MKTVMITGASEGIGRAFARLFARQGYRVTAVARNEVRLKELMSELPGEGHSYLTADLSSEEGIGRVAGRLRETKYSVLINNAGFGVYGEFSANDYAALTRMMRLNCDALLELSHAFLKTSEKGDALINVSSTASLLSMPGVASVYSATKAFVTSFSEAVWWEQKKRGVYVMALCPGLTESKFHERAGGKNEDLPKLFSQTADQVAMIGWKALQRRRQPVVVCGLQRPLVFLSRFIPRTWLIRIAGQVVKGSVPV
jgi:uncharacterized protein